MTVTLGYQSRRMGKGVGEGRSVARVALTLTPAKGSRIFQEQQQKWRCAWVLSKMPVLETGARPTPKTFKELQEAVTAHAAERPVTDWRPEVMIFLRPARYREPVPCRPRRRATGANCSGKVLKKTEEGQGFSPAEPQLPTKSWRILGALFGRAEGPPLPGLFQRIARGLPKVGHPKLGWMEKLLGLFGRKRDEPQRPELAECPALAQDDRMLNPSAFEDPAPDLGYGKDFCQVLDYAEFFIALLAGRSRRAESRKGRKR